MGAPEVHELRPHSVLLVFVKRTSGRFDCPLSGDELHLGGADAEWDLDGDGTPEAAKWNMDFSRQ